MASSLSASSCSMRCTGMPVHLLTSSAMSSASTVASAMPLSASHASLAVTNVSWILSALLLELGGALVVLRLHGGRALARELLQLELHLAQVGRQHRRLDAQLAGRLVEQVDGLVGQEAVADVAVAQRAPPRGCASSVIFTLWCASYLSRRPCEDGDRLLDRRLADEDGLEAALEGGVLLDVLAVLVERRRAHALQLAAGEHRLHHVGGVDGALGGAGAHDGVQLVDEEHHVLGALDLVERALEALLELAAVLGAGDHARRGRARARACRAGSPARRR